MDFNGQIQNLAPESDRSHHLQTTTFSARTTTTATSALTNSVSSGDGKSQISLKKRTTNKQSEPRGNKSASMRRKLQFWETDYLSSEHLTGFDNYKYSAIDTSPLSKYVMHPFWDQAVKLVPTTVAPNVLTFGGFLLNVVSVLLLTWYDFGFHASSNDTPSNPVPPWVWLVCAVNQFMAHTLDGLDGKHARRTGLCGPMGELFDHGLDSWATLFMPLCVFSVFGRYDFSASVFRFCLILWNVHYCFLSSHWEKYNTGILFLPWGYDISQIFLTCTFLLTFFNSHQMWKFEFLGLPSGVYMEAALHIGAVGLSLPVTLWNIYCGYQKRTLRHYSLSEALRPLVAPTIFFSMTTFWILNSPTDILENHPRIMFTMIGTLFANIATRLIINQMTGTRCELVNKLLYVVLGVIFAVFQLRLSELFCLFSLTIIVLCAHIHYGTCVVRQMCDHFRINCFSVHRRPPKDDSGKSD